MGLVSQEPTLFARTIAENILFGKPNANMDQIVEAAKASNAHSFIEKLPEGYQTQVHFFCKFVIFTYIVTESNDLHLPAYRHLIFDF